MTPKFRIISGIIPILFAHSASAVELSRCTAIDGTYSYLTHQECKVETDIRTTANSVIPLSPRDNNNLKIVKCTSKNQQNVTLETGNCRSSEAYQQTLHP